MFACRTRCIAVIVAILTINPGELRVLGNKTAADVGSMWKEAGKMTGLLLHSCLRSDPVESPERSLLILLDCLKRKSLLAFDRVLNRDIIELAEGASLVRYRHEDDAGYNRALHVSENASRLDTNDGDWMSQVADRLVLLTRTHVLKIHLKSLEGAASEGRGRHRKQNMFTHLIMFGIVAAGLIVIPLGFQFLAILGGKALLLAKMALILSSIQGLKKIATSNLNYGLYSTHGPTPWHYDRQWPFDTDGQGESTYSYGGYHPGDLLHPRLDR